MKIGLNNEGMQRANRNLVLRILLENKKASRVEIAKQTHLQRATITNIVNEFLEMGIIHETGICRENGARRAEMLSLCVTHAVILSARITREFFAIHACSLVGEWLEQRKVSIQKDMPIQATMDIVYREIDRFVEHYGVKNILSLCIGMPGPYIRNGGNTAIVTGFEELGKVDVQKSIEQRYPFPCITEHDAKLSAFAEWKSLDVETQHRESTLISIQSIGSGIGSGMVMNGNIHRGAQGASGEIGHMGINFYEPARRHRNPGTFEAYAATGSVKRYVAERLYEYPDSPLMETSSYDEVLEAYQNGDELALAAMDKLAWMVGYGLVNLVFVLNPDRIILSDVYPKEPRFLNRVKASMEQMLYPELMNSVKVLMSEIKMDSTILGGYHLIIDELLKNNVLLDIIRQVECLQAPRSE